MHVDINHRDIRRLFDVVIATAGGYVYVKPLSMEWYKWVLTNLFHRRTGSAYLYNACLAWYNVVLTARSLKREIQTTGAKC